MNNRIFVVAMSFLYIILLGGCAAMTTTTSGYGTKIDPALVAKIKKGVTTRAQVEHMFGQPQALTPRDDGGSMAMYSYSATTGPGFGYGSLKETSENSSLELIYDANGTVKNYTFVAPKPETHLITPMF